MNDTVVPNQRDMFGNDDIDGQAPDLAAGSSSPAVPSPLQPSGATEAGEGKPFSKTPKRHKDATASALVVPASHLGLHPSLGIEPNEFASANEALITSLAGSLRRGDTVTARPQVVVDSDRYLALDAVEFVIAASMVVTDLPKLTVPVLSVAPPDPATTVRQALSTSRGKSGWEQYCAVAAEFEGRGVRDRLRELGIEIIWETRVSKVLKVGQLDPAILDAVERFTIPVKEAGQVVDAWKDAERRERMNAVLRDLAGSSNQRLNAKDCFKALLREGKPTVVEPSWVETGEGRREYVTADGTVLATVKVEGDRWTAEGGAMGSAQWQAFGKSMPHQSASK